MNYKKKIGNAVFLAVVFLLTVYGVFHGQDLHAVLNTLESADVRWLIPGMAAVIFFIWGESAILHYMFGTLGVKTGRWTCFQYSCVGFFFSCITPSATGGQPAQIYYMHRNRISIPVATLVLMIVTITYKSVLVFVGLFVAFFQPGFVEQYLTGILPIFYLGVILNVLCCVFMSFLVFCPVLAERILLNCLRILERLHILKESDTRRERLQNSMVAYRDTSVYLKNHKKVLGNVILLTFLQRFALFFVTWFVYRAFGLSDTSIYDVVMLQAVVSVSVDMLPLPGGMGISESLFLRIFERVFPAAMLLPGMLLSRGIAYYVQLLFSAGMTAVAHITIGRTEKEERKWGIEE